MGYGFCANVEECRQNLLNLGIGRDPSPAVVARIISFMARTVSGLDESLGLQSMQSGTNVLNQGGTTTVNSTNGSGPSLWNDKPDKVNSGVSGSAETVLTTWNIEVFVHTIKEIVSIIYFYFFSLIFLQNILL